MSKGHKIEIPGTVKDISIDKLKIGDIVKIVHSPGSKHLEGHIAIFTDKGNLVDITYGFEWSSGLYAQSEEDEWLVERIPVGTKLSITIRKGKT